MILEQCRYLGSATLARRPCLDGCAKGTKMVVFNCGIHGSCTIARRVADAECCAHCEQRDPPLPGKTTKAPPQGMIGRESRKDNPDFSKGRRTWACGVTTIPQRRGSLLPKTLASLKEAGFDKPRLFVDGDRDVESWEREFDCEVTVRTQRIRTFGNWILGLAELYIRHPGVERYAMFQDDFIAYRNLRTYLDNCTYPAQGYWNLYTFPKYHRCFPTVGRTGRHEEGWYASQQWGLGAVALVFNREAVQLLLGSHDHIIDRPTVATVRSWKFIDGGIVDAMKKKGWKEYVHNPSLVQHTGLQSSIGNRRHDLAEWWRGEEYDALELLKK